MKECKDCKESFPLEEYPLSGGNGKRAARCRTCKQVYDRQWWLNNKERRQPIKAEQQKEKMKSNRETVVAFLKENPCVKCGESDVVVLEFDHIDPSTKIENISDMVRRNYAMSTIWEEIKKCQVLCANCHRRKTSVEWGWHNSI